MHTWKVKFDSNSVKFSEINLYNKFFKTISEVSCQFNVKDFLIDYDMVNFNRDVYKNLQYKLRDILIKKTNNPQMTDISCLLSTILKKYDINLPDDVTDFVSKHVTFTRLGLNYKHQYLSDIVISDEVMLKELTDIVNNLLQLEAPLLAHINELVFFEVHPSCFFDTFIKHHRRKMQSSRCDIHQGFLDNFGKAVLHSKQNLERIFAGQALFDDIIVEDESILGNIDIDFEFSTLRKYATVFSMPYGNNLDGTQAMLELVQLTSHIESINNVCNQYLTHCLQSDNFQELVTIFEKIKDRSQLSASSARVKVKDVRRLLCFDNNTNAKSLKIFAEITDSEDFYQFIKAHKFYGADGCELFNQQYELITAQLQHEEYDESVLHHLKVAFNYMTIIMDPTITFEVLMNFVKKQESAHGFKELSTVNSAMTLINLWFSRSEVILL